MKKKSPSRPGHSSISNRGRDERIDLPLLSSLPDNNKTYFIGGWSAFSNFAPSVSTVANQVKPANEVDEEPYLSQVSKINAGDMNAELEENEKGLGVIPPIVHKIVVLSAVNKDIDDNSQGNVALLTHGMTIEGLSPSEDVKKQEEFDTRIKNKKAEETENTENDVKDEELNAPPSEKKRYEVYYDNDEESQAYDEDGNPVIEKPTYFRKAIPVDHDDLVIIPGDIIFEGIKPVVSVLPPSKKEMQQRLIAAAQASGVTLGGTATVGGKVKRRTEEDKKREAELVARLEAESLAAMSQEVERLNAFADPDRWPTVTILNLAFSGSIVVKRSHIHFSNCHFFNEGSSSKNMVSVTQYCRVSFSECTFIDPLKTALYLFPTAEGVVNQCIFSALPQPKTKEEVEEFINKPPYSFKKTDLSSIENSRPDSVGIHCDSAKINVSGCHFEALSTGVICRGKYNVSIIGGDVTDKNESKDDTNDDNHYGTSSEINEEGDHVVRVRRPISVLTENQFQLIFKASLVFVSAQRTLSKDNTFNECGYYAIQCFGPKCSPQIINSNIQGKIFIGEKAHPFLHGNIVTTPVVNKNDKEPVFLERIY